MSKKQKQTKWGFIESLQHELNCANAAIRRLTKELDQLKDYAAYKEKEQEALELRAANIGLASDNTELKREVRALKLQLEPVGDQ